MSLTNEPGLMVDSLGLFKPPKQLPSEVNDFLRSRLPAPRNGEVLTVNLERLLGMSNQEVFELGKLMRFTADDSWLETEFAPQKLAICTAVILKGLNVVIHVR